MSRFRKSCLWTRLRYVLCKSLVAVARICPGMHFAESVIYMAIVSLLATTTILKPLDENGDEFTPHVEFTGNVLRY